MQNTEFDRLRTGLMAAKEYLRHFKGDAECNLVSFPDSIQKAMDDIQSVLDGGVAGDVYRAVPYSRYDFRGEMPVFPIVQGAIV